GGTDPSDRPARREGAAAPADRGARVAPGPARMARPRRRTAPHPDRPVRDRRRGLAALAAVRLLADRRCRPAATLHAGRTRPGTPGGGPGATQAASARHGTGARRRIGGDERARPGPGLPTARPGRDRKSVV